MDNIDFTLNKTNLSEQIADTLEQAIIRSKSKSEKLPSEQELSKQFNVSRTVTREAFKVLKGRGLITSRNGEGSYITKPNGNTVSKILNQIISMDNISDDELYNMRIILESAGVRLAAEHITAEEIARLEYTLKEMSQNPLPIERRLVFDSDYHITIAKASRNRLLWMFVEVMTVLLHDYMVKGTPDSNDAQQTLKEHKKVIDALKQRDADKADAAIRVHLNASWRNINVYKKEHGE
jgi:GntR family transcriptional repressor for pyruvate dehydrogenase complex